MNLGQLAENIDLDIASNLDKHCSTIWYIFAHARYPISSRSTLQSTMALSTIEADYMTVMEAFKEATWFLDLFDDLGAFQEHADVQCNSQCYQVGKEPIITFDDEAYLVKFYFIRKMLDKADILLEKIGTIDNSAVMLTEMVSGVKFQHYRI